MIICSHWLSMISKKKKFLFLAFTFRHHIRKRVIRKAGGKKKHSLVVLNGYMIWTFKGQVDVGFTHPHFIQLRYTWFWWVMRLHKTPFPEKWKVKTKASQREKKQKKKIVHLTWWWVRGVQLQYQNPMLKFTWCPLTPTPVCTHVRVTHKIEIENVYIHVEREGEREQVRIEMEGQRVDPTTSCNWTWTTGVYDGDPFSHTKMKTPRKIFKKKWKEVEMRKSWPGEWKGLACVGPNWLNCNEFALVIVAHSQCQHPCDPPYK